MFQRYWIAVATVFIALAAFFEQMDMQRQSARPLSILGLCFISLVGVFSSHRDVLTFRSMFFFGALLFGVGGVALLELGRYQEQPTVKTTTIILLGFSGLVVWLLSAPA